MAKPDGRYSRVSIETDSETMSDAQVAKSFHGSNQVVTVPLAVVLALITAGGGALTGYFTRGPGAPVDCASKDSVATLDRRVEQLATSFSALTEKVIADNERMHNDMVDLKLKMVEQNRNK